MDKMDIKVVVVVLGILAALGIATKLMGFW